MRATLEHILTPAAFEHMIALSKRFTQGVEEVIREFEVSWHVTRLGCRAEYLFTAHRPGTVAKLLQPWISRCRVLCTFTR